MCEKANGLRAIMQAELRKKRLERRFNHEEIHARRICGDSRSAARRNSKCPLREGAVGWIAAVSPATDRSLPQREISNVSSRLAFAPAAAGRRRHSAVRLQFRLFRENVSHNLFAMSLTNSYSGRFQDSTKAQKYATRFERGNRRRIDAREQRAVRKIFSELQDCRSVLDVPSGAGRFLKNLAQENREVIEVDVAAEILEFAKERAAKLGVKAQFKQGDASRLPFEDQSVDGIFCNRLLHHIPNAAERAVFLREFHRVSRKYLVVSFFDYQAFGGLRKFFKKLKGRNVSYEGQATMDEFRSEVAQCGFRLRAIVPTGAPWIAQKYFVLEKE